MTIINVFYCFCVQSYTFMPYTAVPLLKEKSIKDQALEFFFFVILLCIYMYAYFVCETK